MKPWLHKIEVFVDKIIPLLLVILLAIIIGEFAFHEFMVKHHIAVEIIDGFIIFIFVLDLVFKYIRIKNFPKFLRASWIEIIAIFPFFLVFRFLEGIIGFFGVGETVTSTQKVVHVGIEVEKQIVGAVRESEVVAKEVARSERFARFLRPVARSIRFSKLGNEDVRKETEKQVKEVVKEAEKGAKEVIKETGEEVKVVTKEVEETVKEAEKVPRHIKTALFYEKPKIMEHLNEKINKLSKKIK
ncbi:hypothetical protein HYU23_03215 [Candidatus Woesearchaeota archaeon]|nr:hypothetical protein [Candidatus Woesearchaeota archaeon]